MKRMHRPLKLIKGGEVGIGFVGPLYPCTMQLEVLPKLQCCRYSLKLVQRLCCLTLPLREVHMQGLVLS